MSESMRCVVAERSRLGESPVWSLPEQALYWLDIKGHRLHRLEADERRSTWELPWLASAVVTAADGRLLLATAEGVGFFDTATAGFELLARPETGRPGNRPNEGKCDPQGRFWVGTMDDAEQAASGALYRVDPDGECECLEDGVGVSNTLAWSPEGGTLYFADSARKTLFAYDFDTRTGRISNRRVFATTRGDTGGPDGSAIDAEGGLWNAQWDNWRLVRYSPAGAVDRIVPLPVQRPTSCCFGGPDLDVLYITTATEGLDAAALSEQPWAGGVLCFRPGVRGIPEVPFGGWT